MIDELWRFLTSAENRAVLSWLGGGITVVSSGIWVIVTSLSNWRNMNAPASQITRGVAAVSPIKSVAYNDTNNYRGDSAKVIKGMSGWHVAGIVAIVGGLSLVATTQVVSRVIAEDGSLAIGGNVSGSTITVGE